MPFQQSYYSVDSLPIGYPPCESGVFIDPQVVAQLTAHPAEFTAKYATGKSKRTNDPYQINIADILFIPPSSAPVEVNPLDPSYVCRERTAKDPDAQHPAVTVVVNIAKPAVGTEIKVSLSKVGNTIQVNPAVNAKNS